MKKFMVFALALSLSLGFFTTPAAHAANQTLGQGLEALKAVKAVHVVGTMNTSWMDIGNNGQPMTIDMRYDATTPNKIRGEQSISSGGFGVDLFLESKIDGDTFYFKLPKEFLTSMSVTNSSEMDTWVKVTPKDIKTLKKQHPDMEDFSTTLGPMNLEKMLQFFNAPFRYQKSIQLQKTGTRTVNGVVVDWHTMTLNKQLLKVELSNSYMGYGPIASEAIKQIDEQVASTRLRNGIYATYTGTTRPYMISGTYDLLQKGKVLSSDDFNVTFTEYDIPIKIIPPKKSITLTQVYRKWLAPSQELGEAAAVKANMANFRASAEIIYDTTPNSYGTKSNSSSCTSPTSGSVFNPKGEYNSMVKDILASAKKLSSDMRCSSTKTAWAWSAKLPTEGYWCIDSTGASGPTSKKHTGTSCGV